MPVPDLATVLAAHQAGDLIDAEEGYRQILAADPDNGEAYHWFGVLASQMGAADLALELMNVARQYRPDDPLLLNNLGNVLKQLNQPLEAVKIFDLLLEVIPDFAAAHYNRAHALRALDRQEDAIAGYRRCIALRPDYADAHYNLALVLRGQDQNDAAAEHFRRYLELDPTDRAGATLALAAMGAAAMPDRADLGYVQALFDRYAPDFDAHLRDRLGYSAPELLAEALEPYWPNLPPSPVAIDIGCGTGLAGVPLRAKVGRLDGVDASPKMIDEARRRGIYDDLSVADLLAWAESGDEDYHLAVAADVIVYFGDLEPLFDGIARRLRAGGLFAFTAESSTDRPITLNDSLRYAHAPDYLRETLTACGFDLITMHSASTRQQADQPVPGLLLLAVKRSG